MAGCLSPSQPGVHKQLNRNLPSCRKEDIDLLRNKARASAGTYFTFY